MSEFTVLSTPEQELIVFLQNVVGLPAADLSLVQQGGAVSVTTRRPRSQNDGADEFVLIMGDKCNAGEWHCVSSTGFRGFVFGTYSLLTLLMSEGPSWFWTPERRHVWRNRYAKARRIISHIGEDEKVLDWERFVVDVCHENSPSPQTLAVIAQLLKEER